MKQNKFNQSTNNESKEASKESASFPETEQRGVLFYLVIVFWIVDIVGIVKQLSG